MIKFVRKDHGQSGFRYDLIVIKRGFPTRLLVVEIKQHRVKCPAGFAPFVGKVFMPTELFARQIFVTAQYFIQTTAETQPGVNSDADTE